MRTIRMLTCPMTHFQSPATYRLMAHPRMIRAALLVATHPFPTTRYRMRMLRMGSLSLQLIRMRQKVPKMTSQPQKRLQNQALTLSRAAWMPRILPLWTTTNAGTIPNWTNRSCGRRPLPALARRCGWGHLCRTMAIGTNRAGISNADGKRRTRCMTPRYTLIWTRVSRTQLMGKLAMWSSSTEMVDSRLWT